MRQREIQASTGQRLLWLLSEYQGEGGSLNCPVVFRMKGPLDTPGLEAALDHLVARHESLRTTFARRGHQLRQVIHEAGRVNVARADLSGALDAEAAAREALAKELRTNIDPTTWPLRATLWRLGTEDHLLCLNMHHLVTDTWSCVVLQRELVAAYAQSQGVGTGPPPGGWQFSQFMAWHERQVAGEGFLRHREYWRRQLAGASAPRLPLRARRPKSEGRRGSVHALIGPASAEGLQALASACGTTLFAVMLSVYYALLNRLTGQPDLAAATLFANRTRREVENTVGFLTNLLVLRTRLDGARTFTDIVQRVRTTVREGTVYQELPYHLVPRDAPAHSSARLDEAVFQMLAEPIDETLRAGGVEFQAVVPDVAGRFDLELALMASDEGTAAKLFYAEERVCPSWARDFISAYVAAAAAVAAEPYAPLERVFAAVPLPAADFS